MIKDIVLCLLWFSSVVLAAKFFGSYIYRVFQKEKTFLDPLLCPLEKIIYRFSGISPQQNMSWKRYAGSLVVFQIAGLSAVFLIELWQAGLPLNPAKEAAVSWDLAFNTAVSFITNTNWQAYGGESTMSYFTQMTALGVQNFLSAATGIAVAMVLMRGIAWHSQKTVGNYWVDMVRGTLWILLPVSCVFALLFVQQGVLQNFSSYVTAATLDGGAQTIAMGPVASQEAIKLLGTNGGGFFNVNSAHPFENPTALTNLWQMFLIFLIPVSLLFTFGRMVKDARQGYTIMAAMTVLFFIFLGTIYYSELSGNPHLAALGIAEPTAMEGQEFRFGPGGSALFSAVTTAASCGAVNSMLDSYMPLGGMIPMLQIMLGEVVFGGVGAGFYGMLVFVVLTVFIVGLMVGRTPSYLGKKIEPYEMKMVVMAVLLPALAILLGSGLAAGTAAGVQVLHNQGPHGLSEILYAYSSAAGNNGSAFAGLNANTLFYNLTLAAAMLIGRFGVIVPVLALAGSLAAKKSSPDNAGTFHTHGSLFALLLCCIVLIVGALTFFPALALGPIAEHFVLYGQTLLY